MNYFKVVQSLVLTDLIDIAIVAFLIYELIGFIRKTNSTQIARGIFVFVIVFLASEVFKLRMINYLLREALQLGLLALVVLFQPEIRRMLQRMGSSLFGGKAAQGSPTENAIEQTVLACSDMSQTKTGALIIFERTTLSAEIFSSGTVVNADATSELIKNLFFNKAPLHDGAVIIRGGRIAAAGCVLPLSKNLSISKELGTRHRAGIGLSEQTDAVVVIVSEETGAISVALEGMLKRHLSAQQLDAILRAELISDEKIDTQNIQGFFKKLQNLIKVDINNGNKE